jgi:hypothetical protein
VIVDDERPVGIADFDVAERAAVSGRYLPGQPALLNVMN